MKLLFCKACEYAATLQNGRQTMVGLFENIVAPSFPLDHPPFFLCVQVEFEPVEAEQIMELTAKLIDQDGHKVVDFNAQGPVPRDPGGGQTRLFLIFMVPPIRFETPGQYRFDITMHGNKIGEELLPVLQAGPNPGPMQGPSV